MEIDERFVAGVYRTSVCVWAAGALVCLCAWGWVPAVGWTVGAAVSLATLRSIDWIVRRTFVPGAERARADLNRFSIVKLPALIAVIAIVALIGGRNAAFILGFCAGVILTQAVIVLTVVGGLIRARPHDVGEE